MQDYKIRITDLAEHDMEDLGNYIAYDLRSPDTAFNMIRGIKTEVKKLEKLPLRHELANDSVLAEIGIRRCYYKNYVIYYVVSEKDAEVVVVRILHMLADSRVILYRTLELD